MILPALAEGVTEISQVTPQVVADADFSARARTTRIGQVVLLYNAAGQPLKIGRSTAPSGGIMRMLFAIQTDGSCDFASFATAFDDPQRQVAQLLVAATEAEYALRRVPVWDGRVQAVGIGRNQPPADFALTENDPIAALEAIAAVRQEVVSAEPSISRRGSAMIVCGKITANVSRWLAVKTDTAADEFAKMSGKTAGASLIAALGALGVRTALQGKLSALAELLSKVIAQ